ncbi:MBOAT family O-acyltransferase [Ekhidna sp.]
MHSLNILILGAYILITILLTLLFVDKKKWIALLISSLLSYFYYVDIQILILLSVWIIVYGFSFSVKKSKFIFRLSVLLSLIPLLTYKLTVGVGHFDSFMSRGITVEGTNWINIFQVLGISYFTFIAISYLIDIKRGYIQPEKNFFRLLLYLSYFPTIFSGPLHRYKYLSKQFENIRITQESLTNGTRLILWGLLKSIVVAPRIFQLMHSLNNNGISGTYYLVVGLLFFLYLFISFSSFIDIFQGVSECINIRLNDNFKSRIYLSYSRQNFWSGWHITLNEWFRDYFFFPLAKKKKNTTYVDLILLLTFLSIAMWHEVSIAMLIWGSCNGLWIVLEKKMNLQKWPYAKFRRVFGTIYHLFFSSILALIFINSDLSSLIERLSLASHFPSESLNFSKLIILIFCFLFMDLISGQIKNRRIDEYLASVSDNFRWTIYSVLVLSILLFGSIGKIDNYYIIF